MSNTITAFFKGRVGVAEAVYQNDYGLVMNLDSLELPAHFDCYFSTLEQDEAIPAIGADGRVAIPNDCLTRAGNVTLHIPLHTGSNDSEVEYVVYFKVIGRARPVDDGTPVQMTAIEQALALLQNPIGNIEQIVNEALSFTGETFAEMQEQLDADQTAFETQMETRANSFETGINSRQSLVETQFTNLSNNLVANSAETLYNNVNGFMDGTITLSKSIDNFDFLDIFFADGGTGNLKGGHSERIPAVAGTYTLKTWDATPAGSGLAASIDASEQSITISGTTFTAASNRNITFSISGADSGSVVNTGSYIYMITKIVGIKMGNASPAELTDVRVGEDNITYTSAGEAVRTQFSKVKDGISQISDEMGIIINAPYEIGIRYVNESGGENFAANVKRMSTKRGTFLELKEGDVVSKNAEVIYLFGGGYSTDGGTTFTAITTQQSDYTAPVDGLYFFWLYKYNEADFSAADVVLGNTYLTVTRNSSVKKQLEEVESSVSAINNLSFQEITLPAYTNEWIRYSDGAKYASGATRMYTFTGTLPKYVKAFLTSDTAALCAIAFFSTTDLSASGYMQSDSVAFASGTHNDGLWYETSVPEGCKAMTIVTKVPSDSIASPIVLFDSTSALELRMIASGSYITYPTGSDYIAGWIRHGTGELVGSAATECYTFENNGISNLKVFTKSDTTVIDAVSFYSGDSISTDTYLQSSVAWAGSYPNGRWYEVTVPDDAGLIAVSVAKASGDYKPIIQFLVSDSIIVSDARYATASYVESELDKKNDVVLSDGWKYIYHYGMNGVAYRDVDVTIPSQSVFDIRNAHNLGYKCIEANVHKTSDGKYVVTHGLDGCLGHDFDTLGGEDAQGVSISANTLSDLQENYRYRSTVPEYRVPITTLEEFCHEAKKYNMIVMFQYKDTAEIDIIRGIMGNRFFMYVATRSVYDGPILWYGSLTTKEAILSKCNEYGRPFIYSMGNPGAFSDEDLQDIINTLHQNGYYIASAYQGGANLLKYSAMGFDFFAVDNGYVTQEVVLDGKRLVFNENGTVTWQAASLG